MFTTESNAISKILMKMFFLIFICLIWSITSNAQTNKSQDEPYDSPDSPIKCDGWHNYIGDAVQRWEKNKDASMIVIVRLGDGETSCRLNLRRIKVLKDYILQPEYSIKAVFAEGGHIKGYGVAEFYIEGKLLYSIPISRNRDMVKGFCP